MVKVVEIDLSKEELLLLVHKFATKYQETLVELEKVKIKLERALRNVPSDPNKLTFVPPQITTIVGDPKPGYDCGWIYTAPDKGSASTTSFEINEKD